MTITTTAGKSVTLADYGLDWDVAKVPLYYQHKGAECLSPYYSIVRQDNGLPLGTCTNDYGCAQNSEIFECMKSICDTNDLIIVNAGTFKDGKKVFFQLQLPSEEGIGRDRVKKYIFALSSHDGKGSLAFGINNRVMSCQNLFNKFMDHAQFKFRHIMSITEKMQEMEKVVKEYYKQEKEIYRVFRTMEATPINIGSDAVEDLITHLFNSTNLPVAELSKRRLNQMDVLRASVDAEMNNKGQTFWGLFNGVTYYANHLKNVPKRLTGREESIFMGDGYEKMNAAYDFISKYKIQLN